ncbi:MOSC domain-containing protein [Streptomyces sp. NBC_00690]|uniref:MOSC domain-containing protein n=1 Tax=Streptomyces sp. NBC_00690 TaxID=2975808 RepID=UPI002E298030|nr:MOSC domain-containing protein [Streptomyces sp. NBC_00690]
MTPARLTEIARYPVKGFQGHALPAVTLTPGRGLPMDRVCGLLNGEVAATVEDGWISSLAFLRLVRNAEIARYRVALVDDDPAGAGALSISAPDGRSVEIRTGMDGGPDATELKKANSELAGWFPAGPLGPVQLTRPRAPVWDWPYAAISLINLDTLDDMAAVSGVAIDPRRFRANLYVSGLGAWREFDLVGHRVRIGDAELEVVQTTDRCRATTVDPDTGRRNLNVPVLLASRYGHMCCGVYARVVRGGTIAPGDALVDLGPLVDASTLPEPDPAWPRTAELIARTPQSPSVTSLTFGDSAGADCRPGQHLRVHLTDGQGAPLWRCYTITAATATSIRISVKQVEEGRASPLLHSLTTGSPVLISGPYGDELIDSDSRRPLVLACAGIGITPVLPVLRQLIDENPTRAVTVINVVRSLDEVPLWDEALALMAQLPRASHRLFVTAHDPGHTLPEGATPGRPTEDDLKGLAADGDVEVYLCGPEGFVQSVRNTLVQAGVPDDAIADELFYSPGEVSLAERPPPAPGPFDVHFAGSDLHTRWSEDDGTLLDVAEAAGLAPPSACRSGGCGTCRQRVTGAVHHLVTPSVPLEPGQALLCCAVPTGSVSVQI